MREELNSKKQLTQIYLIMFSLVLPQLFANITQNNINGYQKISILLLSAWFMTFLFIYYIEITKTGDLSELDVSPLNDAAVYSSIGFGFVVTIFMALSGRQTGVTVHMGFNNSIISYSRLLILLLATTAFIICFLNTLLIKTKKEIPFDDSASEIIKLRSNSYVNMIRNKIGPTINTMDLVYILIIYSIAAYISKFFYLF